MYGRRILMVGLIVVVLLILVVAGFGVAMAAPLSQGTLSPTEPQPLTGEILASALGVILSIALQVVPGLDTKWNDWQYKRATWLGGCLLIPLVILGLVYAGAPLGIQSPGPFIWDGLIVAVRAGLAAYFTSQVTYAATRPKNFGLG